MLFLHTFVFFGISPPVAWKRLNRETNDKSEPSVSAAIMRPKRSFFAFGVVSHHPTSPLPKHGSKIKP